MKTRFALLTLMLVTAWSLTALSAQTRKTAKRKTTPPKSDVANKTRVRRTDLTTQTDQTTQTQTNAAKSESSPEPTPKSENEKPASPVSAATGQPVQETKTLEETQPVTTANNPPASVDPIVTLRDQIDASVSGPERIRLQLKLVEELVNAGKKPEALSELHSITNTDVFDPQGLYNAGNSFARLGDTDGAIEAYRKAIEQRKGRYSRAFNNLGVVMLRVGRWDDAYDSLLSALKLEGFRYAEASYNLGRLYAARGQNDLAVREWRRVLAINPEHTAAAEALARVGSEERVVVEPGRVGYDRGSSERSLTAEKPVSTRSTLSARTLALDQMSFDLLQRARNSTEKGKAQDAIDSYKRLLSRQSGYFPPANLELSFALMSLKRYDEALGNLQIVATRDGARYPISYYHLARVYEQQGDLKQAEAFFSQAATAFGERNAQFLLDISRVREKQGDFKGAVEVMERYLSLMRQQGQEPSWSEERLTALRQKVAGQPKQD